MKQKMKTLMAGFIPPQINFSGATQERTIKLSKIRSSEVTLDDGSTLSIKPFIVDVSRAVKQWNEMGQPMYFVKLGFAINTKSPAKLMRSNSRSKG